MSGLTSCPLAGPQNAITSLALAVQIVSSPISLAELQRLAEPYDGDFVKAVIDVQREVMAIGGDLHADEETVLLESGGPRRDLWGIKLYVGRPNQNSSSSIR